MIANITMGRAVSNHDIRVALFGKKAGTRTANTASLAVHGTNGANKIVKSLLRSDSMIRVPMMAGTLHPKPRKSGMKLLPCKPIVCIKRSIT